MLDGGVAGWFVPDELALEPFAPDELALEPFVSDIDELVFPEVLELLCPLKHVLPAV